MPVLYVVGGVVSLGLLVYLFVALLKPEALLMSWQGYAQIVVLLVVLVASVKPLGAYMARVYEGEPIVARQARSAGSSASSTALCGVRATPRSAR